MKCTTPWTLRRRWEKISRWSLVRVLRCSVYRPNILSCLSHTHSIGLGSIEADFNIPSGALRLGSGVPCSGDDCTLALIPPETNVRLLLCTTHNFLHRCNRRCTYKRKVICKLWAAFLGNKYRADVSQGWQLLKASAAEKDHPETPFWFNRVAGVSQWQDGAATAAPSAHLTTVHRWYVKAFLFRIGCVDSRARRF